jgi:hypothetical protein
MAGKGQGTDDADRVGGIDHRHLELGQAIARLVEGVQRARHRRERAQRQEGQRDGPEPKAVTPTRPVLGHERVHGARDARAVASASMPAPTG